MLAAIGHGGPVTSSPKRVSARPKWPAKLQLSPTSLSLSRSSPSFPFCFFLLFPSLPPIASVPSAGSSSQRLFLSSTVFVLGGQPSP